MTVPKQNGFTLLEVAIVMIIIGLVMGGGLAVMRTMTDRKFRNEAVDYLNSAKKAVLTFSEINGRLPWADSDNPPDGNENAGDTVGALPYNTIGVAPSDPYGRPVAYEINAGLVTDISPITNRVFSCNTLQTPLTNRPRILDADAGAGSAVSVAAVMISAGPMDGDNDGDVFDATTDGNNRSGTPNYLRNPPLEGAFDDLTVYITGNELFGGMCETLILTVNDARVISPPPTFYVYDIIRNVDLGNATGLFSQTVISGTQIEVRTQPNGSGATLVTEPPTPFALAGQDRTFKIP